MSQISIRKEMQYQDLLDKVIGGMCGFFGGMILFVNIDFLEISYWASLGKACGTALLCGFFGVGGKHLFSIVQKWWRKRKKLKIK
jgi:hypothetical protein